MVMPEMSKEEQRSHMMWMVTQMRESQKMLPRETFAKLADAIIAVEEWIQTEMKQDTEKLKNERKNMLGMGMK